MHVSPTAALCCYVYIYICTCVYAHSISSTLPLILSESIPRFCPSTLKLSYMPNSDQNMTGSMGNHLAFELIIDPNFSVPTFSKQDPMLDSGATLEFP